MNWVEFPEPTPRYAPKNLSTNKFHSCYSRSMWNGRSLLRACEGILTDPTTTLRLRTVSDPAISAHVSYGTTSAVSITIDPAKGGLIEGALHETLHVVLSRSRSLPFNSSLEEIIIRALEDHLWKRTFRKEDVSRWRRLINSRLQT